MIAVPRKTGIGAAFRDRRGTLNIQDPWKESPRYSSHLSSAGSRRAWWFSAEINHSRHVHIELKMWPLLSFVGEENKGNRFFCKPISTGLS